VSGSALLKIYEQNQSSKYGVPEMDFGIIPALYFFGKRSLISLKFWIKKGSEKL
jgi:hypothetical protein